MEGKYVVLVVNYYSRKIFVKMCRKKETNSIVKMAMEILGEKGTPKMLITNKGCDFTSEKFKKMCQQNKISHHTISPKNIKVIKELSLIFEKYGK